MSKNNLFAGEIIDAQTARKAIYEIGKVNRVPPAVGIFDSPTRCFEVNLEWWSHIAGMVHLLADVVSWQAAEDEGYFAITEILRFMQGTDCGGDCTIEILLADEIFLVNEYLPTVFGDIASNTEAEITALETAYDGTPQSVAPDVPVGAPSLEQQNALCYAITKFTDLYASQKLCAVQSKNFLQAAWTRISNAANFVWNGTADLLSGPISIELFDCLVTDALAITALEDTGAIEELGCFLYDELQATSMSLTSFNNALEAAVTDLTGNAQAIACLMQGDGDLATYLLFLKAYNIALLRQIAGDDLECPCEVPTTYWRLYMDFRTGNRYGTISTLWNGAANDGYWNGDGYVVNTTPVASTLNVSFGLMDFGSAYAVRAAATISERQGSDGSGTNDTATYFGFPNEGLTGTFNQQLGTGSNATNGTDVVIGQINAAITNLSRSFTYRSRVQQATNVAPRALRVHQLVLWGLADAGGNKPPGSVWAGSSLPATVAGLFP